jgi:peptidoglycan/xylan/chitin deacetylase (PgdA/CDA1 family)
MLRSLKLSRQSDRRLRVAAWGICVALAILGGLALSRYFDGITGVLTGALFAAALLFVADSWMRAEGGVPVLVYHSVSRHTDWLPWAAEIAVSPASFENHLRTIRRLGCTVLSTSEFIKARQSGRQIPGRPVVLHLDDGYLDNWVAAVPLLKDYGFAATIFISLDFIESSTVRRPTLEDVRTGRIRHSELPWSGYMNWREVQAIQATGLVDIQPHGIDHGRVETGPDVVDHLCPENWRRLAWVQWGAIAGSKADWHRHAHPPARPYGTPVRRNDAAFAARAWSESTGRESQDAYEARVRHALGHCREVLRQELGIEPIVFCWPQNRTSRKAREIAYELGYVATTAGRGENRLDEDPREISRLHVSDRVLGWPSAWADNLALAANIRLFQGNYYWYLPLLAIRSARLVMTPLARFLVEERVTCG